MELTFCKGFQKDDMRRRAYNALTRAVFDFDLEAWYQEGNWTASHIPYTFFDGDKAVASAAVNVMGLRWRGEPRGWLQIGTVMTEESYRRQGLLRRVMERIFADYGEDADYYLFANDTVLDFYPKFGFRRKPEFYFAASGGTGEAAALPVSLQTPEERAAFLEEARGLHNPNRLTMENDGIRQFHLSGPMKESAWRLPDGTLAVAQPEEGVLHVQEVFTRGGDDMRPLCAAFGGTVREVRFPFPPCGVEAHKREIRGGEDTLFVRGRELEACLDDPDGLAMFPFITHT